MCVGSSARSNRGGGARLHGNKVGYFGLSVREKDVAIDLEACLWRKEVGYFREFLKERMSSAKARPSLYRTASSF